MTSGAPDPRPARTIPNMQTPAWLGYRCCALDDLPAVFPVGVVSSWLEDRRLTHVLGFIYIIHLLQTADV